MTEEQRDFSDTITTAADTLLTIISDILDFSKVEAGALELERMPMDLTETIENSAELVAAKASEKGVELADRLKEMVPEGMSLVDLALRWILDFEAVTTIIPGATRPEQVMGNVRASDLPRLSPELHGALGEFYRNEVRDHIRGPY